MRHLVTKLYSYADLIIRRIIHFTVIFLILSPISGCSDEQPPTTWEDAKNIKNQSSLDGVGFDVPLNYELGEFQRPQSNWPKLTKKIREGKTRPAVDFIKIHALLPDLEPVTEENIAFFMDPSYGRKIHAFITHPRSFQYFFTNTAPKSLERLPDSAEMPGMLHYRDNNFQDDVYLSHDHDDPNLIFIRCHNLPKRVSPSCGIETVFRHKFNHNQNDEISTSTTFYLGYKFSKVYLPQWREIDYKVKALFEQFAVSTTP